MSPYNQWGAPQNGVVIYGTTAPVPVAQTPAPRRIWLPNELTFDAVGADGRWSGYRYISASNTVFYSQPCSFEGCSDLTIWVEAGKTTAGALTLKVALMGGMVAGQDYKNNATQLNGAGAGVDTLTTSTTVGAHMCIWTGDLVTNSNVLFRGFTPLYWHLAVTPSAANLPFTVWAVGR